ncbi:MAG: peptidylprolyl isomerase [Acidimicrobiales bacterium]
MPNEKRARQKALRRQKKAAEARRTRRRKLLRNGGIVVVLGALVIGLVVLTLRPGSKASATAGKKTGTTTTSATGTSATGASAEQKAANAKATAAGCPASTSSRVNTMSFSSPPPMTIDASKTYTAAVATTAGTFTVTLLAKTAPTTVNSFVYLAQKGFYHCVIFHRVITGFMDQTGDPTGTGTGGPGYHFTNENVPSSYATGDVAMANSGAADTNGSQFFVVVPGGATVLNQDLKGGSGYSLFGKVTSGMTVVEKINAEGASASKSTGKPKVTQRILSVTIHTS